MLTVQAPPTAFDMQVQRWTRASPDYPRELNDLAHPPRELYTIGRRSALSIPRVAIVGTRDSTAYGERITRTLTWAAVPRPARPRTSRGRARSTAVEGWGAPRRAPGGSPPLARSLVAKIRPPPAATARIGAEGLGCDRRRVR